MGGPKSKPLAKGLDHSCFHSNSSGIPYRIYEFFNLILGSDNEKKVILKKGSEKYDAILLPKLHNRYILQWDSNFTDALKADVPKWESIEANDKSYDSFLYFLNSGVNDQGLTIYEVDVRTTYS